MSKVTSTEKKKFSKKLLEFQKKGLQQYGKYLNDQLKFASRSDIRKHYKKYIEDQIAQNIKKIKTIEGKL
jgi:uncharacterized membrane protein YgaE (UPF0421/DUF939 family)